MRNEIFTLPEWQCGHDSRSFRVQYQDIHRLDILSGHYRCLVRDAVTDYRAWKLRIAEERDVFARFYALLEGQYLQARVNHSWRIYRMVRAELTRVRRFYRARIIPSKAVSI